MKIIMLTIAGLLLLAIAASYALLPVLEPDPKSLSRISLSHEIALTAIKHLYKNSLIYVGLGIACFIGAILSRGGDRPRD